MFVLEYCDDPNKPVLQAGNIKYESDFQQEYIDKLKEIDRFTYLIDMYTIMESCAEDLISIKIEDVNDFWKVNKALLNYVNAVYSYKEFVNSYDPPLREITEKYYLHKKWYRFVCDYRNRVIHQSTIIKDYSPGSNEIYVDLDEVIEIQNSLQKANSVKFKIVLEDLKGEGKIIKGRSYLSMKYVTQNANEEIAQMRDEILLFALKKGVEPVLDWLLSLVPIIDEEYKYAFIVDKSNLPDAVCEPNYNIENFYKDMKQKLGEQHIICKNIESWFESKNYGHMFN